MPYTFHVTEEHNSSSKIVNSIGESIFPFKLMNMKFMRWNHFHCSGFTSICENSISPASIEDEIKISNYDIDVIANRNIASQLAASHSDTTKVENFDSMEDCTFHLHPAVRMNCRNHKIKFSNYILELNQLNCR